MTAQFRYDGDLSFTFASGLQIRVPNHQLVVPDVVVNEFGVPTFNDSTRAININSLQEINKDDTPSLGQTFLTAAYLLVDFDQNQFVLWQSNPTLDTNIMAIGPDATCTSSIVPDTTYTTYPLPTGSPSPSGVPGSSGSRPSNEVIIGGTIGGVVFLTLLVILLFYMWRKRRLASLNPSSVVPFTTRHHKPFRVEPQRGELCATPAAQELPVGSGVPELDSGRKYEMAG